MLNILLTLYLMPSISAASGKMVTNPSQEKSMEFSIERKTISIVHKNDDDKEVDLILYRLKHKDESQIIKLDPREWNGF